MNFKFHNLNDETRDFMFQEIEIDLENGTIYLSPRLTNAGRLKYPDLLKQAVQFHDEQWLASQIAVPGILLLEEQRRKPSGGYTTAKVPATAATTLAEGEFNRFYCRGICRWAIAHDISEVRVYRARLAATPRPESVAKEGTRVSAQHLLADLRTHQGVEPALGLPPGPNSGLSVELP